MKKSLIMKAGRVLLKRKVGSLSPEEVLEELNRIRSDNNNRLSPEAVIKASKDKNAPFHGEFTWDNKKAAHKWRISEANSIIQAVMIKADTGEEKPAYRVKVIQEPIKATRGTYVEVSSEEMVGQQVKNTLVSIWQRHRTIRKFEKVWRAIEDQFDLN